MDMGPGVDGFGIASMSRNGCHGFGTGINWLGVGFYRLRMGLHDLG